MRCKIIIKERPPPSQPIIDQESHPSQATKSQEPNRQRERKEAKSNRTAMGNHGDEVHYPPYTPIASLGQELGILFAFSSACILTVVIYAIFWQGTTFPSLPSAQTTPADLLTFFFFFFSSCTKTRRHQRRRTPSRSPRPRLPPRTRRIS